ncbi:MAG: hypothetical protein EPN82_06065 [Bacteroidetes bacterium]|nr:MAG: hypothetical protein EPN82_06065 [Bacteroidota bacterium]
MYKFKNILFIAILIIFIVSCTDINEIGNNTIRTPILPSISKEDSLSFLEFKVINFGDIRINHVIDQYYFIYNNSDNYTVLIYNLKLKNNFGFSIYPEKGYPILLSPKHDNLDNKIIVRWNTYNASIGFYRDTIFVNNSNKFMIFIEGNVKFN